MSKKVVVLNGSPVAGGCSEILSDYLIQGVQENGNTAVKMNLSKMNLHPCIGCNGCKMGKGNPCVQNDDMTEVYQVIQRADVIVWASPPLLDAVQRTDQDGNGPALCTVSGEHCE